MAQGRSIGDPIEAAAIGTVLGEGRRQGRPIRLGSVKTNIGHLEAAAGIAGLIKACLLIHHRVIPPNLHFVEPNPDIDFSRLKLTVPTMLEPWPEGQAVVAGVNSFGFGGTNAHVLLGAPPDHPPAATAGTGGPLAEPVKGRPLGGWNILSLSAESRESLQSHAAAVRSNPERRHLGPASPRRDLCRSGQAAAPTRP